MRRLALALAFVFMTGCGATSQAGGSIAQFTSEALLIEETRENVVDHWSQYPTSQSAGNWFANGAFGYPIPLVIDVSKSLPDDLPDKQEFVGVSELAGELALLETPSAMQPIKDALLLVYQIELAAAADHGVCTDFDRSPCSYRKAIYFDLNKDNVEEIIALGQPGGTAYYRQWADSSWAQAQKLRASTYERWYEILLDHDLDPTLYPALIGSQIGD